jgi:hypothetical protein
VRIEAAPATTATGVGTSRRASRYTGTAVRHMTAASRYLISAYPVPTEPAHQPGAIRNAYSDLYGRGSPSAAACPVAAIARDSCAHSSSSLKIVGDFRLHACHM